MNLVIRYLYILCLGATLIFGAKLSLSDPKLKLAVKETKSRTEAIADNQKEDSQESLSRKYSLPHCQLKSTLTAEVSSRSFDSTELKIFTTLNFKLQLYETACFLVHVPSNESKNESVEKTDYAKDGTLLYTIRYERLEHHHAIRQRYQFGIPSIKTECKCDCMGGDDLCPEGYGFDNCDETHAVCYKVDHRNTKGCKQGKASTVCCDYQLRPHRNWRFWALDLLQPEMFAVFQYKVHYWNTGKWVAHSVDHVKVQLNHGHRFENRENDLRFVVSGGTDPNKLREGVYFVKDDEHELRKGLVNHQDTTFLEYLGWFRVNADNQWTVPNGRAKLKSAHWVSVNDCIQQTYTSNFNAAFYLSESEGNKTKTLEVYRKLNDYVDQVYHTWVDSATVKNPRSSRAAVVSLKRSPYLHVEIEMNSRPIVQNIHSSSSLTDFVGKIQLDKYSNRFLNVTFISARGHLIGNIYRSESKHQSDVAVQAVGWSRTSNPYLQPLPATVDSDRFVCFYPAGRPKDEQCHWLRYYSDPLESYEIPHAWIDNQGSCDECNTDLEDSTALGSVGNFLSHMLNPIKWFDGATNPVETFALIIKIVIYLVVILLIVAFVRKCLCPIVKWSICTGGKKKTAKVATVST